MNAPMQLLQTSPVGTSKKSQWEGRDVVFPYFSKDFDDFSRTIFGGKDFLYPEKEKTTSLPGVVSSRKKIFPKKLGVKEIFQWASRMGPTNIPKTPRFNAKVRLFQLVEVSHVTTRKLAVFQRIDEFIVKK